MPRTKTTPPDVSRQKGERNLDPLYFNRFVDHFVHPEWYPSDVWRTVVANQPFATICRDTVIAQIQSLDWKIEPKESLQREELKSEIKYYTDFITNTGDYSYSEQIEWIGKDMQDLPFGAGAEIGRKGDEPDGKVLWIDLLDGATLYPTNNRDWPVAQNINDARTIFFPKHAINRAYYSPRTAIKYKGWGMPPPEKVYLALELLRRGDVYYANLLLDTPEIGILDLLDMEKTDAEEWVKAWREMLTGIDPFKIPVLYQHTKKAEFIPFTRSPTELMYDKTIMKYAAINAAGYGLTLSDIGISAVSSGGETLAGSIRQERKTRRTGIAVAKRKYIDFYNNILPKSLMFKFIDLDDEVSVAVGRSRLANSTAMEILIANRVLTPEEARLQMIADGLVTISIPEKIPESENMPEPSQPGGNGNHRYGDLGKPISPSQGGYGEQRSLVQEIMQE